MECRLCILSLVSIWQEGDGECGIWRERKSEKEKKKENERENEWAREEANKRNRGGVERPVSRQRKQ